MPIHSRRIVMRFFIVVLVLLALTIPARPAPAAKLANSDPMAIISAVNALRATQGLPPYIVDQSLMSYALEHSRYQASLHTATHQHSDGTTVWQHGMDENIAEGMLGMLTPEYAVYTIWSDAIHMKTMIGYATGYVGAGVADDGADEYYTLDVRPGSAVSSTSRTTTGKTDPNATPTKIIPIVPLLTVTPRMDRWMIHTVGYGQSLWAVAIAYGVKMDQIRDWNSMAKDSNDIYAGQKLYIIAPGNIWPTLTASPVGQPSAATANQTVTPGWSITEEPAAATAKAAYQTAAAQTQVPMLETAVVQGTVISGAQVTGSQVTGVQAPEAQGTAASPEATASPTTKGQPTASPITRQGTASAPSEGGQGESLPLIAGLLILFGGGLLMVIMFSVMRKR